MDFKTNNTAEGFHRDYNTQQEKDGNYKSVYKSIQVIKNIHSEKKCQVESSIAGVDRDPMAKAFLKRAEKQQKIVSKYKNYDTNAMKLKCLHEIASSFTLCFADCEEDYEDDEDEEDSDDEEDKEEESEN